MTTPVMVAAALPLLVLLTHSALFPLLLGGFAFILAITVPVTITIAIAVTVSIAIPAIFIADLVEHSSKELHTSIIKLLLGMHALLASRRAAFHNQNRAITMLCD